MTYYKDLDLKAIRDKHDLDFAHFTYKPGMCSCCYGPRDLPALYWKNRVIPTNYDFTYLLFKNADNGSGHVKKSDEVQHRACISWKFPMKKMQSICNMLLGQLDAEYYILMPPSTLHCIVVCKHDAYINEDYYKGYVKLEQIDTTDAKSSNEYFAKLKKYQLLCEEQDKKEEVEEC